LSQFRDPLLEWLETTPDAIVPNTFYKEVRSLTVSLSSISLRLALSLSLFVESIFVSLLFSGTCSELGACDQILTQLRKGPLEDLSVSRLRSKVASYCCLIVSVCGRAVCVSRCLCDLDVRVVYLCDLCLYGRDVLSSIMFSLDFCVWSFSRFRGLLPCRIILNTRSVTFSPFSFSLSCFVHICTNFVFSSLGRFPCWSSYLLLFYLQKGSRRGFCFCCRSMCGSMHYRSI